MVYACFERLRQLSPLPMGIHQDQSSGLPWSGATVVVSTVLLFLRVLGQGRQTRAGHVDERCGGENSKLVRIGATLLCLHRRPFRHDHSEALDGLHGSAWNEPLKF